MPTDYRSPIIGLALKIETHRNPQLHPIPRQISEYKIKKHSGLLLFFFPKKNEVSSPSDRSRTPARPVSPFRDLPVAPRNSCAIIQDPGIFRFSRLLTLITAFSARRRATSIIPTGVSRAEMETTSAGVNGPAPRQEEEEEWRRDKSEAGAAAAAAAFFGRRHR